MPRTWGGRGGRAFLLSRGAVLAIFALLLVFWMFVWVALERPATGPNGIGFDNVFATYLAGAHVLASEGNIYDPASICRAEYMMLHGQNVPVDQPLWNCRLGNPPLVSWVFQPVESLPYRVAGLVWWLLLGIAAFAGTAVAARALHWRHWLVTGVGMALMPPVLMGMYYGEINALLVAGLCIGFVLLQRHPVLAGALLATGWVKPTLTLPFACLLVFFCTRERMRPIAGFAAGTLFGVAATCLICGPSTLVQWIASMLAFTRDTGDRGHISSLLGLYVRVVAPGTRTICEAFVLVTALALTVWFYRSGRWRHDPLGSSAWLWGVWFLAIPYGQYYDEIALALPFIAWLGRDGARVGRVHVALGLFATLLSVLWILQPVARIDPLALFVLFLVIVQAPWSGLRGRIPTPGNTEEIAETAA